MNQDSPILTNSPPLTPAIGPWQATALNITFMVGAGVFVTIPVMLSELPGPYALVGWIAAGVLILLDGMIWSELGAALPGSGGTYQYLLEGFGRERWGRLLAFLFICQFLLSGPLELGSGLVAIAEFSTSLSPAFADFDRDWTWKWDVWKDQDLKVSFGPARLLGFLIGLGVLLLLYRNIRILGRLTVTFWLGVMAAIAWILIEGWLRFSPSVAFDFSGPAATFPADFGWQLGPVMILAIYSYLGYYNVCYIGDEVRDPGRTIPIAIRRSALIVIVLFIGLHLAMLGTVSWREVPADDEMFSLPAEFMRRIHGQSAATIMTCFLIWCCTGSLFAGLLGYSRIPYGAARNGHFFSIFARVHPTKRIPHVSLWLVGGLMLFWVLFDIQTIINALITTRIIEQFVAQAAAVVLLRRHRPQLPRPYRMPLYPWPCLLASAGWLYLYFSAGVLYVIIGAFTMALSIGAFLIWSRHTGGWPFENAGT